MPEGAARRYLTFFNFLDLDKLHNQKVLNVNIQILADVGSVEEFGVFVKGVQGSNGYRPPWAFAMGVALMIDDEVVAVQFPHVNYIGENGGTAAALASITERGMDGVGTYVFEDWARSELGNVFELFDDGGTHANIEAFRAINADKPGPGLHHKAAQPVPVVVFINDLGQEAVDVGDVYLRLHLLSHRKVQPQQINLGGIFDKLKNLAWTSHGVFLPEDMNTVHSEVLMTEGKMVQVFCLDKFPPMLGMVVPTGVRVADGNRVRLGAHLAQGTTVMHEGFINFNAGTIGPSMVEGRVSAGVVVGDGSDIGGGASIMGTLSGGGKEVISIGEGCLLGANSGLGVSLGDRCTVEAGLYVTPGTVVTQPDGTTVKARELSGRDNLLFRRNSVTGSVEVLPNDGTTWVGLNTDLHSN